MRAPPRHTCRAGAAPPKVAAAQAAAEHRGRPPGQRAAAVTARADCAELESRRPAASVTRAVSQRIALRDVAKQPLLATVAARSTASFGIDDILLLSSEGYDCRPAPTLLAAFFQGRLAQPDLGSGTLQQRHQLFAVGAKHFRIEMAQVGCSDRRLDPLD